jgi:hypothetical protein
MALTMYVLANSQKYDNEVNVYLAKYGNQYSKKYKKFFTKCAVKLQDTSLDKIDEICNLAWNRLFIDWKNYPEIQFKEREFVYTTLQKSRKQCILL